MDSTPYFSDFDPTAASAEAELSAAEQWRIMQDADTASTAMILDSHAYTMEVNDAAVQNFNDYITGNDTAVDTTADASTDVVGATQIEGAAPQQMDTLPDGREVLVIGDTDPYDDFHQQGANDLGFTQDCGLVSSQDVLNQFGVEVSENDVVHHAVENGECQVVPGDAAQSGGTSADWQAQLLSDYGVPAHVENGGSIDDLATNLQDGHSVIVEVNAGVLWDDPNSYGDGSANHAITVTGAVRDPETSEITGFIVNDSGDGKGEKFIDAATMQQMWVDTGGQSVVTDLAH